MNRAYRILYTFILLCLTIIYSSLNAQYASLKWDGTQPGSSYDFLQMTCSDVDGNGQQELILGGQMGFSKNGPGHISVLNAINNKFSIQWTGKLYFNNPIRVIKTFDLNQDKVPEICVFLSDGLVDVYSSITKNIISSYQTHIKNINQATIYDIDSDGSTEITVINDSCLAVLNNNCAVKWADTKYKGSALAVGNIDIDEGIEIILGEGKVLNGKTHEIKWNYAPGFGSRIELADIDNDLIEEIIGINNTGATAGQINAFDGLAQFQLWQIKSSSRNLLIIDDINSDGTKEILTDTQLNGLQCFTPGNLIPVWTANLTGDFVDACIGDVNNDNKKEIIARTRQVDGELEIFDIIDLLSGASKSGEVFLPGPFSSEINDLDNDGVKEIVSFSKSYSWTGKILDGVTHTQKNSFSTAAYIHSVSIGNIDNTPQNEIVLGTSLELVEIDGKTLKEIRSSPGIGDVQKILIADVDSDGKNEVITAGSDGHIRILDPTDLKQKWEIAPPSGSTLLNPVVGDCDGDNNMEILCVTSYGAVLVYDCKTYFLEWNSGLSFNAALVDFCNVKEKQFFIVIKNDGKLVKIDTKTHSEISETDPAIGSISRIKVANLDKTPSDEIVLLGSSIKVYSSDDLKLLWESNPAADKSYSPGSVCVSDLDQDGHMDIIVGSLSGIYQYSVSESYIISTNPLQILSHSPQNGEKFVPTEKTITINFSKPLDIQKLISSNIYIQNEKNEIVKAEIIYNYYQQISQVMLKPFSVLPLGKMLKVVVTADITDENGTGLDGNRNGLSEGVPADNYSWTFTTGTSIDTVGPRILNLKISADTAWKGMDIWASMEISDSSDAAVNGVKTAEYFIDIIKSGGLGSPVVSNDGLFNTASELASFRISTDVLDCGNHKVYVHAKDSLNNWGAFTEASFYLRKESQKNWSMLGGNPQHDGFNWADTTWLPLKLEWIKRIITPENEFSFIFNNPVVYDDMIYLTAGDLDKLNIKLYAINIKDGTEAWSYSLGQAASVENPAAAYGLVFAQVFNIMPESYLYAFDALTGRLVWKSAFPETFQKTQGPVIAKGKVIFNAGLSGIMYAYDALSGKELWRTNLPQSNRWTPAFYDNHLYIAHTGPGYYKIDIDSGKIVYCSNYNSNRKLKTPLISSGKVITSAPLAAIDLLTGQLSWSKSGLDIAGGELPAVADNCIFYADTILKAYDSRTGNLLWSFAGDGKLKYSPVVTSGCLIVSSDSNSYALNLKTKKADWSFPVGGRITAGSGNIFIYSKSGKLYCFSSDVTSVNEIAEPDIPKGYSVSQNYPNPFNPITTISYSIPARSSVVLKIFDVLGNEVACIVNQEQSPGSYKVRFEAKDICSGIYFYSIKAGNYSKTGKMIYMR